MVFDRVVWRQYLGSINKTYMARKYYGHPSRELKQYVNILRNNWNENIARMPSIYVQIWSHEIRHFEFSHVGVAVQG